jgi:16S rRNA (uracil1498-N3)-methyltransferase
VSDGADRVETRLYVEEPLQAGATLGLDHARAHFLRAVLRLKRGARIAVFNGRDGEWAARLDALGKGWASLVVEDQRRDQEPGPDLWLVFATIKRARLDFLVEKAVELGVSRLQPAMSRHTAVSRVNRERLVANAREAAEQCERLDVPEVGEARPLFDIMGDWPSERRLLVCSERSAAEPLSVVLQAAAGGGAAGAGATGGGKDPWAILVGPEGGFARSELDGLLKLPFVTPVGLGPRILRADTAALFALACWQAFLGDGAIRPAMRET